MDKFRAIIDGGSFKTNYQNEPIKAEIADIIESFIGKINIFFQFLFTFLKCLKRNISEFSTQV